jgi:monovalent cation:H+ antiporter-2, CPA2 family
VRTAHHLPGRQPAPILGVAGELVSEVPLLVNITVALVVAFAGGLFARRIGLPTIVGYLLAGIAIGPFTPGFVGDTETIRQLAELGIIFLMFGVGLNFSLRDLWKVRDVAMPGALGRMALTTLMGVALGQLLGWTLAAGLMLGLAISIASTVVLFRGLIDNGLLNTPQGQAAVGWVVLEDLLTVLILVLLPAFAATSAGFHWQDLLLALLKAGLFVLLLMFFGTRLIPWLLLRIAHTRSRDLFILAILAITLGTALGAAHLFGVSLALGAFIAGVVVSESPFSHQVGADVLPFREAFAVLFFVSIGMLVNPSFLLANIVPVLALTGLIVVGKAISTLPLGLLLPWPARTTLVLAVSLSQIGEFSFVLGQEGVSLGLLTQDQFSLILAGALLSIVVHPFMYRLLPVVERRFRSWPPFWRLLDRHGPSPAPLREGLEDHVVVVGGGCVGRHIVQVLDVLGLPQLVIESDAERVEELNRRGVATLFGDAANSEVLIHAGLSRARALVVTIADETSAALTIATARVLAPDLPIIARGATREGVKQLSQFGAQTVIHPEMEGGLEIVRHLLLQLGFPLREVYQYAEAVRQDHYDILVSTDEEHRLLHGLLDAADSIEIVWLRIPSDSPIIGQTLAEANLRARTGASVVAILRDRQLLPNPKSMTVFQAGDRLGLIGEEEQIDAVKELLPLPIPRPQPSRDQAAKP